MNKFHL